VAAARVVPVLDPFEDGEGELATALPPVLVEQLSLHGREDALATALGRAVIDTRFRP
jgi:hypothetical protein